MMQTRGTNASMYRLVIMYQSQQINTQDITTNMTTTNAHRETDTHAHAHKQPNGDNRHPNDQRVKSRLPTCTETILHFTRVSTSRNLMKTEGKKNQS